MRRLLDEIELRNFHQVYETDSGFEVIQIDRHKDKHIYSISREAADFLYNLCKGKCVTREEAFMKLEPYAKKLGLKYHYGHKLGYYTQDILLVLAATNRATIRKVGRGFEYQVTG